MVLLLDQVLTINIRLGEVIEVLEGDKRSRKVMEGLFPSLY